MPDTLPDAVRALLRDHIESYEHLEILLLLHRQPHESWTEGRLAERTGFPPEAIDEALNGLARAGCVTPRAGPASAVRYAPGPGQADAVAGLASAYEENRLAVIRAMNTDAIERVRTAAIHTFADAFVIGRKKDG